MIQYVHHFDVTGHISLVLMFFVFFVFFLFSVPELVMSRIPTWRSTNVCSSPISGHDAITSYWSTPGRF